MIRIVHLTLAATLIELWKGSFNATAAGTEFCYVMLLAGQSLRAKSNKVLIGIKKRGSG
jgi:hypothetical protein